MIEDLQSELSRFANQLSSRRRRSATAARNETRRPPSRHWLAVISVCAAVGVALCATGDALSRSTHSSSQLLFWLGLLVIVAPVVARLLSRRATRGERISLVVVLGLALYLVKVVRSPFGLDMMDELAHAPNSQAILRTHDLFSSNPILPVTAHYPGLESVDAALASMTGLTPYGAGLVVIGVARVVIMLALFLLYERLSGSARTAGLAAAIYTANASFLYFDSQVSYESLALALLVVILFAVAEWREPHDRGGWASVIVVSTLALVATHHLTSYVLLLFLLALCLTQVIVDRSPAVLEAEPDVLPEREGLTAERKTLVARYMVADGEARLGHLAVEHEPELEPAHDRRPLVTGAAPWAFLLVGAAATIGWLAFVAGSTVGYLSPVLSKAFLSTIHTVAAESQARPPFTSNQGYNAPLIERAVGFGSYMLIAIAIPFGLRALRRRYGRSPFVLLLGLISVGFYAVAALRLAPGAWETAERATEFLFLGLGFVLALAVTSLERWSPPRRPWLGRAALVALICVIFVGGVISGTQGNLRLSSPYRVQVGGRAIVPAGRELASWAAANLPSGSRYAASDTDARFLATYADGYPITGKIAGVDIILRSPGLPAWQRESLTKSHVKYVVVDRRDSTFGGLGFFFAPQPLGTADLLPRSVALKFTHWGLARLYDNGTIKVYRWTGARHAPLER